MKRCLPLLVLGAISCGGDTPNLAEEIKLAERAGYLPAISPGKVYNPGAYTVVKDIESSLTRAETLLAEGDRAGAAEILDAVCRYATRDLPTWYDAGYLPTPHERFNSMLVKAVLEHPRDPRYAEFARKYARRWPDAEVSLRQGDEQHWFRIQENIQNRPKLPLPYGDTELAQDIRTTRLKDAMMKTAPRPNTPERVRWWTERAGTGPRDPAASLPVAHAWSQVATMELGRATAALGRAAVEAAISLSERGILPQTWSDDCLDPVPDKPEPFIIDTSDPAYIGLHSHIVSFFGQERWASVVLKRPAGSKTAPTVTVGADDHARP